MSTGHLARLFRGLTLAVATLAVVAVGQPAAAQYQDATEDVRFENEGEENAYQIVGRIRGVGVPNFLLNVGYDRHAANWSEGQTNFAYGLEFLWRKVGAFELSVAAEYAGLGMPGDFWLESGKSPDNADYVDFELGVGSLVFSGYYYWDVGEWFSPYIGGGLGLGAVFGDVTKYNPKQNTSCRNNLGEPGGYNGEACFNQGETDPSESDQFQSGEIEDRVWPVIPMVNVTTGARFNIGDHGVVKAEFGFYDYLFVGVSGGAQW